MRTIVSQILSHVCIDSQTIVYLTQANRTTDQEALISSQSCVVARVNATHRVFVQFDKTEGKCPDASDLSLAANGYQISNTTGKTSSQVYKRVEGVMSGKPVLECKNSTSALGAPPAAPDNDIPISPDASGDLGSPGQASSGVGVWIKPGVMQIITPKGFGAVAIAADGRLTGITALYLSHKCLSNDTYIAANVQERLFFGGKTARGSHCERGTRNGNSLILTFSEEEGPDCKVLETSTATPDETLALYEAIPDIPAECTAVLEASGDGSDAAASSAVHALLGGAAAIVMAALIL